MPLTSQQLTTLKTDIDINFAGVPNNADGHVTIAAAYNLNASPSFTVWKTSVPIGAVGDNFNGTELAGLTTGNQSRLQTIAQFSPMGINPSLSDRRAFFDDVFSGAGGATTRGKLLILWKRLATRGEKLFATGTGSDAVPATLVVEGLIHANDVERARQL
jgi:hypothetical protein